MNSVYVTCIALLCVFLLSAVHEEVQADENDVYVITSPERSLEQINQIYSEIPPIKYIPPKDRFKNMPRTAQILKKGTGELRIVMLGDSIINDTSRSSYESLLQQKYPSCKISKVTSVRGSTGCWWYKEPGRVQRYVLDYNPTLVIIGGISQRDDVDSIREVIWQIRASSDAEILLLTGPFGTIDPNDDKQFSFSFDPKGSDYRAKLFQLSREEKTGFMDLYAQWGAYIKESGHPVDWFKRDVVHANEKGEQVIGRLLLKHLEP